MEDLIKKVLYTGVGLVASATEKVQDTVNDLVATEKINKEEGQKIVNDFVKSTEDKKGELESRFTDLMENVIGRLNLVKKSDVQDLIKRVEELEEELAVAKK